MPPIPIEKMEGPDLLAKHYKEVGITSKRLARKHNKELDAKETKFFQYEGKVTAKRNVIAWGTRQKARQDAQTNLGLVRPEKIGLELPSEITLRVVYDDKLKQDEKE